MVVAFTAFIIEEKGHDTHYTYFRAERKSIHDKIQFNNSRNFYWYFMRVTYGCSKQRLNVFLVGFSWPFSCPRKHPFVDPVERLYFKMPIQCLASSKILTHIPSPPGECVPWLPSRLWCGGRTHSLGGERVGGNILEDARHYSVLYICKYFMVDPLATPC